MQNVFCFVFFPSTFTLTAELRMNIFIIPRAPSWFTIEFRDHFAYSQELKESGEVHVVALYKKAGIACFPCTPLIPHSTDCKKCKHSEKQPGSIEQVTGRYSENITHLLKSAEFKTNCITSLTKSKQQSKILPMEPHRSSRTT